MNALQSYSSDDEPTSDPPLHKIRKNVDPGTNYDNVGMDISEDSDDDQPPQQHHHHHHNHHKDKGRAATTSCGGRPPGASSLPSPAPSPLSATATNETHKLHTEAKDGPRSRSRSKSRERESRPSQQGRDHSGRSHGGRDQVSQGHSGRGRESREGRRSRDDDRKRRDEDRRSRRSRSRSRSRERRRSRSRSRDRRSRSRSRDRRRRSRSRERKRPMDIRKEAQQKLALLKAANPDLTAAELLKRSMEAQMVEVQKQTGIALPSYYNPAAMNPMKFAEQERKKKLLWGNKNKAADTPAGNSAAEGAASNTPASLNLHPGGSGMGGMGSGMNSLRPNLGGECAASAAAAATATATAGSTGASSGQAALWANTRFSNDRDGKMAEKFRRLMGVKSADTAVAAPYMCSPPASSKLDGPPRYPSSAPTTRRIGESAPAGNKESCVGGSGGRENPGMDILQKQETMFTSMERQYEMARIATHTHKGFGLGFTSQSFMPK
ncbi:arginine/serine-rich coiled-coil protein 2 isoform X7 [Cherax quadricarinatus]|uniref:arginine/serine-rich coiled-coil protein 2 isoform X7 n=1 Tax=Cherax quadricarinatus TaxID=27406 RepID=UPI0023785C03|nr:arginine/serine-rich coiled-coil protein 2-like isoform X7 [Cherax quadricarinatus]